MSAKACNDCGRLVVFAKDNDERWQVLDNQWPIWKQIGFKDGAARVIREPAAFVSHICTARPVTEKQEPPKDHIEPKEIPWSASE